MTEKQPAHVEQALAELASAGNEEQAKAAQKRLDAAGYEEAAKKRSKAAAEAAQSAESAESGESEPRKAAPKGRTTRQEAKGSTT